jgi:hypothetical protein
VRDDRGMHPLRMLPPIGIVLLAVVLSLAPLSHHATAADLSVREPASLVMFGTGLIGIVQLRRWMR